MRLYLWRQAVRFWWHWLRLVHKHGWEKAVVDAKCRFWGFKFLPNRGISDVSWVDIQDSSGRRLRLESLV
jgi:hypothetical protein